MKSKNAYKEKKRKVIQEGRVVITPQWSNEKGDQRSLPRGIFFPLGFSDLRPPSTGFAHWTSSLNTWGISISPALDKSKQSVSKTDNQLLSLYPFSELKQLNWELNFTLAFKKCQKGPQTQQRQVHTRTQSGCLTTGKLFSLPSCFS